MVLPDIKSKKFTDGSPACKIVVTGAGGFIGSHLARRLKNEGHFVRAVDWKENEYMKEPEFCDEFLNLDLRYSDACEKAVEGCDWCFNLAADMGGMGFIQSNHSRILYNSTMISFSGCICSIFSISMMKCVGSRIPPKVPPTASMSIALSTRDSAVSPKQCSFQYEWL